MYTHTHTQQHHATVRLACVDIGGTEAPWVFNYWWPHGRTRSLWKSCVIVNTRSKSSGPANRVKSSFLNRLKFAGICWAVNICFSGKWDEDRCIHHSLIHLPSLSFSLHSVFLAHVSFLCQCFPSSWRHRRETRRALRKTLLVSRTFFHPCVVPSIPGLVLCPLHLSSLSSCSSYSLCLCLFLSGH